MRYPLLFIGVALLLSVGVLSSKESAVNFSGEWALNADKSDLGTSSSGRRRSMAASKMVVQQEDNKLVVEAFRTNRDGEEVSMVTTYTLDGKECKNESDYRTMVSVAQWSEEGKMLTISSTITMSRGDREFTMESTEKWSLDEEALAIDRTVSTSRGERTSKAVYDKLKK